ncbi:MAG: hypothetical protein HYV26_22745 [Candidatus Hydrogenedentes bacterium]|nr:hypothetical protein [Candidatus Hydrogenedentota bacterium]
MASVIEKTKHTIATTSQLYVWWMVTFKGYRVDMEIAQPRGVLLGRVRYTTTWMLEPRLNGRKNGR